MEDTYDVVVLAADRVGRALIVANADDGDGRALDADDSVDALDDNTEQAQEHARDRVGRL